MTLKDEENLQYSPVNLHFRKSGHSFNLPVKFSVMEHRVIFAQQIKTT